MMRSWQKYLLTTLLGVGFATFTLHAQTPAPTTQPQFGGVKIDAEGLISARKQDHTLAVKRDGKQPGLGYVSLTKAMAELKSTLDAGKKPSAELLHLGGLTQIRYILIYPEQKDLVIAGNAEALDTTNPTMPVGKSTGRPALRLDDLITLLRLHANASPRRGETFIGCSIDLPPNAMEKARDVMQRFPKASNAQLADELKKGMGPQTVQVLGVQGDTRVALSMVAADFTMKRMSLGLEPIPVAGIGSAVESGKSASSRFWFEPAYEPISLSEDGFTYEIKGPRLQLKAGVQMFDTKGATETAKRFAENFSKKFPDLAVKVTEFADLQNVTDLALVASLIQKDRLLQKAGADLSWAMDAGHYKPETVPTPLHTETQVSLTSSSVAAGGVSLSYTTILTAREVAKLGADVRQRPDSSWFMVVPVEKKTK